jgi:uncharacterized membrane protein
MNWFFIALIPPLLDGFLVHIDKHLLSRYFKGQGAGALLIFSSLIGVFIFPIIFFLNPHVISIDLQNAMLLIVNGFLGALLFLPYFHALEKDEASIVVPLFQTIPIFSYVLAFFVLGEVLSTVQVLASMLILSGAVLLSLDLSHNKPKIKKDVFFLMMISSFLYALTSLIFKFVAVKGDFWTTVFWQYVGLGVAGVLIYFFVATYRKQFLTVLKINKRPVLSLNILNEIIHVFSTLALHFATLLAPLALVWVVVGFQPFFVFIFGVLITLFFPKFGMESLVKKHLLQKIIAISIMFIGAVFINS